MTTINRTDIKAVLSAATRTMLMRRANAYNVLYAAAEALSAKDIGMATAHIRDITGQCMGGATQERHEEARARIMDELRAGLVQS